MIRENFLITNVDMTKGLPNSAEVSGNDHQLAQGLA
jgi:hypothetical protein